MLTEDEEFELLSLEREKALAHANPDNTPLPSEPSLAEKSSSFLTDSLKRMFGLGAVKAATAPISKPLATGAQIIHDNPEGALEALPAIAATGASVATMGAGAVPAMLAAGGAGAAGRGLTMAGRAMLGKNPISPEQPKIPFTNTEIPDIPYLPPEVSRMAIEGATQAALEGGGRAVPYLVKGARAAAQALDKKVVAPLQQLLTGIPGKQWLKLSEDLKVLKPEIFGGAPSKGAAGAKIGEAENAAGLFESALPTNLGKPYVEETVKQMSRGFSPEELSKPEIVQDLVKQLTPQEAFNLRHAVKNVMDSWVEGKQMPEFRQYTILKNALNDYIGEVAPAIREAQKVFSDAAQRSKFTSLFPLTKYGQPSVGRLGFTGMIMSPMEGLKRAILLASGTSPAMNAGARASTSLASKAVQVLTQSPQVDAAALRLISAMSRKAKEMQQPKREDMAQSDGINDSNIVQFVRSSPVGTRFTYQGKKFKVVPAKRIDISKLPPDAQKMYLAFKSRNPGSNTYEPA